MNLEDDLKRQLVQTPGMGFSKAHREAVLAQVRKLPRPTDLGQQTGSEHTTDSGQPTDSRHQTRPEDGPGSSEKHRRPSGWQQGLRWTSAALAACILVAGGTAAYLHQTRQSGQATKKVNKQTINKQPTENQSAPPSGNSKTSTVGKSRASGILLANGTSLLPSQSANVPQMPLGPALAAVPVVKVPVHAAVTMPTPSVQVPATIEMPVAQSLTNKVAAYFFQLANNNSFYLLGPAGLTGTCQAAADGSIGILLQGHGMTLSLMTYGASVPIAEGQAAPLMNQARLDYQSEMGLHVAPLAHADVVQMASDTTAFGFNTKSGNRVFGFDVFHSNGPNGLFYLGGEEVFTTSFPNEEFTKLVPWILANGMSVVSQASSSGPLGMQSAKVTLGGHTYTVDEPASSSPSHDVTLTPGGVVWWQAPSLEQAGTGQLSIYPTQPYTLYLSPTSSQFLSPDKAKSVLTLPYFKGNSRNGNELFAYGGSLTAVQNWVVFPVAYRAIGMNQPAGNNLYAWNVKTAKDTLITSFVTGGGMFFFWGHDGQYIVYDQQGLNAQGGLIHNLNLYDLATGTNTKLPSSDILSGSGQRVQVTINGQSVKLSLQQS